MPGSRQKGEWNVSSRMWPGFLVDPLIIFVKLSLNPSESNILMKIATFHMECSWICRSNVILCLMNLRITLFFGQDENMCLLERALLLLLRAERVPPQVCHIQDDDMSFCLNGAPLICLLNHRFPLMCNLWLQL